MVGIRSDGRIMFQIMDDGLVEYSLNMDVTMALWLARELTTQALRVQVAEERTKSSSNDDAGPVPPKAAPVPQDAG